MRNSERSALRGIDRMTERQVQAVGARLIWRRMREIGLAKRQFAAACIRMQTYF